MHWMSLPSINQVLLSQPRKRRDSRVEGMDLNTLLNTNRHAIAAGHHHHNMQYEVPMSMDMNHNMPTGPHYASQNLYVPNGGARIKSENGSDGRVSPHTSEQSSRYPSQTPQNLAYQQIANSLSNGMNGQMRYPSPSQLQAGNMPLIQHSYHPNAPADQSYQQTQLGAVQQPGQQDQNSMDGTATVRSANPLPKAFACSTCSKGFARRSDLARHGQYKRKKSDCQC